MASPVLETEADKKFENDPLNSVILRKDKTFTNGDALFSNAFGDEFSDHLEDWNAAQGFEAMRDPVNHFTTDYNRMTTSTNVIDKRAPRGPGQYDTSNIYTPGFDSLKDSYSNVRTEKVSPLDKNVSITNQRLSKDFTIPDSQVDAIAKRDKLMTPGE